MSEVDLNLDEDNLLHEPVAEKRIKKKKSKSDRASIDSAGMKEGAEKTNEAGTSGSTEKKPARRLKMSAINEKRNNRVVKFDAELDDYASLSELLTGKAPFRVDCRSITQDQDRNYVEEISSRFGINSLDSDLHSMLFYLNVHAYWNGICNLESFRNKDTSSNVYVTKDGPCFVYPEVGGAFSFDEDTKPGLVKAITTESSLVASGEKIVNEICHYSKTDTDYLKDMGDQPYLIGAWPSPLVLIRGDKNPQQQQKQKKTETRHGYLSVFYNTPSGVKTTDTFVFDNVLITNTCQMNDGKVNAEDDGYFWVTLPKSFVKEKLNRMVKLINIPERGTANNDYDITIEEPVTQPFVPQPGIEMIWDDGEEYVWTRVDLGTGYYTSLRHIDEWNRTRKTNENYIPGNLTKYKSQNFKPKDEDNPKPAFTDSKAIGIRNQLGETPIRTPDNERYAHPGEFMNCTHFYDVLNAMKVKTLESGELRNGKEEELYKRYIESYEDIIATDMNGDITAVSGTIQFKVGISITRSLRSDTKSKEMKVKLKLNFDPRYGCGFVIRPGDYLRTPEFDEREIKVTELDGPDESGVCHRYGYKCKVVSSSDGSKANESFKNATTMQKAIEGIGGSLLSKIRNTLNNLDWGVIQESKRKPSKGRVTIKSNDKLTKPKSRQVSRAFSRMETAPLSDSDEEDYDDDE